ncbi:exodeoxyribonuclease V subunit alpha [Paucibacter sp. B2R-40]|uniref:exodeoxyribonuclease V subunit alpha n=1 Tax=Paucibacter sp. B2R-40 TaxID=2893554 RepID=UPI0021E4EF15|nr:exodeoxyribonuclease V subunit alpha [Paucibacter sp. B2R-40]MCV2356709.1 exodeoxyribonuclease V subunit alpha [Paucibacter sp. B2R-40]
MTPLLATLKQWTEQGWLRRLDAAFAAFVAEQQQEAPPLLLLAAALVAHLEGRGHSCVALDLLLQDSEAVLGWKADAAEALRLMLQEQLPADLPSWLAALRASPLVWVEQEGQQGGSEPLVLSGAKLYLRRMWSCEQKVAQQVLARVAVADRPQQSEVRRWLDLLFPETGAEPALDWQKLACGLALNARLGLITGGPGTGKTYTVARLLALLFAVDPEPQRLRVGLAAPTGKAATRLKQAIDSALGDLQTQLGASLALQQLATQIGPARTLHSMLGARPDTRKFKADAAHPLALDVLIVDEASMIHLEMMAALLEALPPGCRLILLGDKDQLASVEAGAVLGDLCTDAELGRYLPATAAYAQAVTGQAIAPEYLASQASKLSQQTVMLRRSHRFGGPIGQLALAVNRGDARSATELLRQGEREILHELQAPNLAALLRLAVQGRPGAEGGYRSYLELVKQGPAQPDAADFEQWVGQVLTAFERFRLLCAVREGLFGALGLNQAVEQALLEQRLLVKRGEWYEGRPVMVTRNDVSLGVFNGDIGIVLRPQRQIGPEGEATSQRLRAYFSDGAKLRSVAVSRLADVETAFAMTVHKSQGSEFEHTVLVLPTEPSRVLTRELVYTGITRARKAFTLVNGWPPGFTKALALRTRRASGLLDRLADSREQS